MEYNIRGLKTSQREKIKLNQLKELEAINDLK